MRTITIYALSYSNFLGGAYCTHCYTVVICIVKAVSRKGIWELHLGVNVDTQVTI